MGEGSSYREMNLATVGDLRTNGQVGARRVGTAALIAHRLGMLLRSRPDPLGFIEPCAPVRCDVAPAGPDWSHEVKHDGWRIIARKDGDRVRLWSHNGRDWTADFPAIVAAVAHLPNERLVLDGEVVGYAPDGLGMAGAAGVGTGGASVGAGDRGSVGAGTSASSGAGPVMAVLAIVLVQQAGAAAPAVLGAEQRVQPTVV
jgi:bifunctional non-homologous end joining protein LigD